MPRSVKPKVNGNLLRILVIDEFISQCVFQSLLVSMFFSKQVFFVVVPVFFIESFFIRYKCQYSYFYSMASSPSTYTSHKKKVIRKSHTYIPKIKNILLQIRRMKIFPKVKSTNFMVVTKLSSPLR